MFSRTSLTHNLAIKPKTGYSSPPTLTYPSFRCFRLPHITRIHSASQSVLFTIKRIETEGSDRLSHRLQPVRPRFIAFFSPNLLISKMNTSAKDACHRQIKEHITYWRASPGELTTHTCLAGLQGHFHLAYMYPLTPIPNSGWVLVSHIFSSAASMVI